MHVCKILIFKIPENLLINSDFDHQFFKPSKPHLYVSGQLNTTKQELHCC